MSKWELLRSALKNGERDAVHNVSIHRFQGFQKIPKRKCLWTGYELHIALMTAGQFAADWLTILDFCEEYFIRIDTTECLLTISGKSEDVSKLQQELATGSEANSSIIVENWNGLPTLTDLSSSSSSPPSSPSSSSSSSTAATGMTTATFRMRHTSLIPTHRVVEFHRYELLMSTSDQQLRKSSIYTREPPKNKKISSQDLLSDRLYGVDNTGNICVWPSEPLLLHLFLTQQFIADIVHNKSVLEIGGGMTALVGLGLAAMDMCKDVRLTDGHPHCVANQV
jgi:hypothetical protein